MEAVKTQQVLSHQQMGGLARCCRDSAAEGDEVDGSSTNLPAKGDSAGGSCRSSPVKGGGENGSCRDSTAKGEWCRWKL